MPHEEYVEYDRLTGLIPFAVSGRTVPCLLLRVEVSLWIPFSTAAYKAFRSRWCVMIDHRPPTILAGEKETLLAFLTYLRGCLVAKLDDISLAASRRSGVPSGTCLLGLVKHLTAVEAFWFQHAFAGLAPDTVIPDDQLSEADTTESVIHSYREVAAATDEIVLRCDDLGSRAAVAPFGPPVMSLRWILVHMIEEVGRHAGHADILREQIDGVVGR
jgi:hypothetical protein